MLDADFSRLPNPGPEVFTAPLKRPAHVGDDWLEPAQHAYDSAENAIWDDLFARQMDVLPGRAASAFMAGLEKLDLGRGGVPDFGRLSEELGALTGWSVAQRVELDSWSVAQPSLEQVFLDLVGGADDE